MALELKVGTLSDSPMWLTLQGSWWEGVPAAFTVFEKCKESDLVRSCAQVSFRIISGLQVFSSAGNFISCICPVDFLFSCVHQQNVHNLHVNKDTILVNFCKEVNRSLQITATKIALICVFFFKSAREKTFIWGVITSYL